MVSQTEEAPEAACAEFKPADRLKAYSAMAETSRKWVSTMDAKAGFVSALNAALLAFIWSGSRFGDEQRWPLWVALGATAFCGVSLLYAIATVFPVESLTAALRRPTRYVDGFKAISFYGYVASNYPEHTQFERDVWVMGEEELAREALEQHFVISHIVRAKSQRLTRSALAWIAALTFTALAMVLKRLVNGC